MNLFRSCCVAWPSQLAMCENENAARAETTESNNVASSVALAASVVARSHDGGRRETDGKWKATRAALPCQVPMPAATLIFLFVCNS